MKLEPIENARWAKKIETRGASTMDDGAVRNGPWYAVREKRKSVIRSGTKCLCLFRLVVHRFHMWLINPLCTSAITYIKLIDASRAVK